MNQQLAAANSPQPSKSQNGDLVLTSLDKARREIRPAVRWCLFFTFIITVLGFSAPLYMMNLYGRVLSSRNETTLVVLTLIVVFAIALNAIIITIRADILRRASVMFDRNMSGDVFDAIQRAIVRRPLDKGLPSLRDIDVMRDFISGPVLPNLMSLPFFPIFIAVCWMIHPSLVALVLVTSGIIAILNYFTSKSTSEPLRQANQAHQGASKRANAAFQNFEAVHAMGMRPALRHSWQEMHDNALSWNVVADDRSVGLRMLSSFFQRLGNTAVLALAAYLTLNNEMSPAMIFGVGIIVAQATKPLHRLVGSWRSLTSARQAYARVNELLQDTQTTQGKMRLPPPVGDLSATDLAIAPPGKGIEQILLRGITFDVKAGSVLAIIGPSASGKSSLARALIGVWKPLRGTVRIDGTDINNWNDEDLGPYIGYLPQSVELFPGTVAENIGRFTGADHESIIRAAERAGVHAMIQGLPDGYNTKVGDQGQGLSGGQRQRIGLARAMFGNPTIIVLDEPNSNLDAVGEEQLSEAIRQMRTHGVTVVFVTHKVSILSVADYVVVLGGGTMKDFGPCGEVMQRVTQPRIVELRSPGQRGAPAIGNAS